MNFFGLTVRRPVALFVAFITLLVIGAIAYARIPLQLFPSGYSEDSIQIWIPNPGGSARENEEKVARPIEDELNTLQGIRRLRSNSSEDLVTMSIAFQASVDMDLAKAEVRDRLERATPKLPDTVEPIGMWSESSGSMPLAFFSVTHLGDSDETDYLVDEVLTPRLEAADGVSKVQVWGSLQDTVRIQLDEERVVGSNMDVMALINGLSSDNFAEPLGEVVDGGRRLILRSDMRFGTPDEIADYPLSNGLKVSDVGRVKHSKSVRDQITRVDGKYAYFGIAEKESTANVVEASRNFSAAIEAMRNDPEIAGKVDLVPFFLQGDLIEASLDQLLTTASQGGLLAAIVLLLFLRRVRTTLCIAAAIPFSAMLALAFEYFTGGSFNILTMIGITLAIGMLVDNAVVVVENIIRVRPECNSDLEAAAMGTREIALPVTLATLTTVVTFLPIIFINDQPLIRLLIGNLGIPLCTSLIASLLVAIVFLPVITARIIKPRPRWAEALAGPLAQVVSMPARLLAVLIGLARYGFHIGLALLLKAERVVVQVLFVLRYPLALALVIGAGTLAWLGRADAVPEALYHRPMDVVDPNALPIAAMVTRGVMALIGVLILLGLVPRWRKRLNGHTHPVRPTRYAPQGHSLIEWLTVSNRALVRWTLKHRLAAISVSIVALASIGIPFGLVDKTALTQGEGNNGIDFGVRFEADFTLSEASAELAPYEDMLEANREAWGFDHWRNSFDDRSANLSFFFADGLPASKRTRVLNELREQLPQLPGHSVYFYDTTTVSETSNRIATFMLQGTDSAELAILGREAKRLLEAVPGLSGVTLPDAQAPDEIRVSVERDTALSLGYNSNNAVQSINWALRGQSLPRFQERGREIPLIIEYDTEDAPNMASLRDLPVYSVSGQIPLSSIADFEIAKGSSSIRRVNGKISHVLTAEVNDPANFKEITERGYAALGELSLPRGFEIPRGESVGNRANEESAAMFQALLLSIVLVFLVMGVLFESILLPFSVLTTIPFAMMGAMWVLFMMGTPLDSMGFVGLIILAGVVVNNGIVLIDLIHNLRNTMTRDEAVLAGCAQRVRPIVMTALTTVIGLIPMSIVEPSSGSIDYRAMGSIVIGGLLASTFFTLWVVPLAYTLLDDMALAFKGRFRWALRRPGTAKSTT